MTISASLASARAAPHPLQKNRMTKQPQWHLSLAVQFKAADGLRQLAQSFGVTLSNAAQWSWRKLSPELDALAAEIDERLSASSPNPLLTIEQLRGRVLHYQERNHPRTSPQWLNRFQDYCDAVHFSLREHPEIERWRAELIAYERVEYQREQAARNEAVLDRIERQRLTAGKPENASC
jgi:hypothetical protein